jgi:hypothetical protein
MTDLNEQLLQEYSKEIYGTDHELSLKELIDSHKILRAFRLKSGSEMRAENDAIYERTKELARKEVLCGEYVSVANLSKMTLAEISSLIENLQ